MSVRITKIETIVYSREMSDDEALAWFGPLDHDEEDRRPWFDRLKETLEGGWADVPSGLEDWIERHGNVDGSTWEVERS